MAACEGGWEIAYLLRETYEGSDLSKTVKFDSSALKMQIICKFE